MATALRRCNRSCGGTTRASKGSLPTGNEQEDAMGKGILMWLIGIPIPIIILLLIFWH